MQFVQLKRQRQIAARHQLFKMRFDQRKQHFTHLFPALQATPGTYLQRHMDKGVIMFTVGHLPGIQPVGAAADAAEREDARGGQRLVDFGEQPRQVGLLADVVGAFSNKVRHGGSLGGQGENGVNLAGAGAGEQLGEKLHLAVVFVPAEHPQQHHRVVHVALAVAVVGVLRQHAAEFFELALAPELYHPFVHLAVELAGVAVHPFLRALVVNKAVRQRAAGEHRHGTVVFFDGADDGLAQPAAVGEVVNRAKRRDGDHFEVLIRVHVAHRYQRAVLQLEARNVVRFGAHAELHRLVGNQLAKFRVAVVVVGHVANKVRQLVAGVDAREMVRTVDVIGAVHQPVGVEHDDGVHAQLAAALTDLFMPVDGALTAAVVFARQLGEVHRWHVGDFCC